MAALGAAAGAFEGDNAREEQRARRAGLGLQAASLAQQDRQFVDRQTLEREQMALEQQRFQGNQDIANSRTAMEQRNADRGFALDEQKLAYDKENDLYQRGRNEKQDAWKNALDEETLRNKQMEYQTNEQLFQEAAKQRQIDDEKMANRKKIAQGAMGVAIRAIAESPNNVLSPSQIEYIKKLDPETYGNLVGGYGAGVGKPAALTFKDPKTGEARDEVIDPDKQFMIYDTVYGKDVANKLTGRQEQEAQNAFNLKRDEARYNSQLERDTLKAGNILDPMKKIRYTALQREHGIALKALLSGSPEEDDAEGYKQKKDALQKIESEMVALEGVGSPSDKPVEAPGTKYGLSKTGKPAQSSSAPNMDFLKKLKQDAIAAHPGDEAKQIEYFKRELAVANSKIK